MYRTIRFVLATVALATVAACATPNNVTYVSEERRVWVVRQAVGNDAQVFRCADGAMPEQPPKPVCVRAPMHSPE